jgi:PhnB protein
MSPVKPIPQDHHTVTPGLSVKNCAQAIEYYKKALGAVEIGRFLGPGDLIMHASIKIGDSIIFLADEIQGMNKSPQTLGGTPCSLTIYTEDCDALFNRAVQAGGKVAMPMADQFWGDRWGSFTDPYGHIWSIATHKEDLSREVMIERGKAAFAQMSGKQ